MDKSLKSAVLNILRPLVRHLIGQGWTYPALCEMLKSVYVGEAEKQDHGGAGQVTDSRISLLTGVHRKDVKRLREEIAQSGANLSLRKEGNLAARVVAAWVSEPAYQNPNGAPIVLPFRIAEDAPSFEGLVRQLKADVRAKSVLDELLRVGVAAMDYNENVYLLRTAYVSSLPEEKLHFLGMNVGDHLQSALFNLEHPTNTFLERAVYYDSIPQEELRKVRHELAQLGDRMLRQANRLVMPLDTEDAPAPGAKLCRMRLGVYYYEENTGGTDEDPD